MELETFIQARLRRERERFEIEQDPVARQILQDWISTVKNAPRSADAVQALMDATEVEMNQADDLLELRRLGRERSALEWLQGAIRKAHAAPN